MFQERIWLYCGSASVPVIEQQLRVRRDVVDCDKDNFRLAVKVDDLKAHKFWQKHRINSLSLSRLLWSSSDWQNEPFHDFSCCRRLVCTEVSCRKRTGSNISCLFSPQGSSPASVLLCARLLTLETHIFQKECRYIYNITHPGTRRQSLLRPVSRVSSGIALFPDLTCLWRPEDATRLLFLWTGATAFCVRASPFLACCILKGFDELHDWKQTVMLFPSAFWSVIDFWIKYLHLCRGLLFATFASDWWSVTLGRSLQTEKFRESRVLFCGIQS